MMRVRVGTSVLAVAVGWTVLAMSGVGWGPACVGGLVSAGVDQIAEITQSIQVGTLRFRVSAIVLIVQRVLPLAGLGVALAMGASPFSGVAVGAGLTAVLCLGLNRRLVFSLAAIPRGLARQSRQYWLAALLGGAQQFDVAVVRLFGGASLSATYAAVSRIASPLNIVTGSALSIFAPVLSAIPRGPRRDREARVLIRIAATFSGLIVLASPLIAYLFVKLLGARYEGAVPLVLAFCVAAALSGVSQALQAVMIARGRIGIVAATAGLATITLLSAVAVLSASVPALLWIAPVATQLAVFCAYGWAYHATRLREVAE
jgi:O-antigen/teichoic acid export membrane protein